MQRIYDRMPEFDERSRAFPVRGRLRRAAQKRVTKLWRTPVCLDQGTEGACTGFAVCGEAAAEPVRVPGITNAVALKLYRRARQLDQWPGEDYDGSSVLAAMKAAMEQGWYTEYRWAFGEEDLALAVGHIGPAVLGINWYEGMETPDRRGIIRATGECLGGHAILCKGYDARRDMYRLLNSWSRYWGKRGECWLPRADLARLLKEDGEACIPLVRATGEKHEE